MANGPLLTVVVIVYNDAGRLPRAVQSVLRQTLRDLEVLIVDDASTDATPAVAQRLVARAPDRVRYERLATNSGGCSRPRNEGIDRARGRYVMFLDSDDELPPRACETLVRVAEEESADFSSGLCHRVHLSKGGVISPWYRWLYTQRTAYSSILENPDLLYDTLSTNKCYRKDFLERHGLRFPDGYHYEDLLFSGEAYLYARRFVLVPDVVYRWNVVESVDTPSISNRRSELRNFEDRVRIHRLLDERFAEAGAAELRMHKDVKFLRHDLVLYLPDLPFRDDAFRERFRAVARDYLQTFDPRALTRVHPVQALVAWFLMHDDEAGLFTAIDFTAHGRKLSTRLARRDGRILWSDRAPAPADEALFDVTELGFHELPLARLDLYDEITELHAGHDGLRLAGRLLNQLDIIPRDASLDVALVLRPRRGSRSRVLPVTEVTRDPATGDVLWRATVDTAHVLRAVGFVDRVWDLRLRVTVDGQVNESRLTAREATWDGLPLPGRPAAGRLAADSLQTLVTPQADLSLEWVPGTRTARGVHRAGQRVLQSPTARRGRDLARRTRVVVSDPLNPRVRERVLGRALRPVRRQPREIVFESEQGRSFGGSPRAVYDEIRRRGLDVTVTWVHAGDPERFPADVRRVRHGSWGYYAALKRASAWVDDAGFPRETVKSPGTVYVHTPPGTPLAWVGFDAPVMKRASNDDRLALRRIVDRWDALTVRAPYDDEVYARAYRHSAESLRVGLPRNDRLVDGGAKEVAAARRICGVADDATAVLYLPECDKRVTELTPALAGGAQIITANDGEVTDLLLACDVLVTDHHPAMFDVVLRDVPVVVIGCSCSVLRDSRGSVAQAYVDLDAVAPGPVVWDAGALGSALSDLPELARSTAGRRAEARKGFAEYETGRSAAAVVDFLIERCAGWRASCDEVDA